MKSNILFIILNLLISIIISSILALPWWSFLVMSLVMGFIYTRLNIKIKSFSSGFISGFLNWVIATLFFHFKYDGILLPKLASILFMPFPILIVSVGFICGLLNGLACFSGYSFYSEEDKLELN